MRLRLALLAMLVPVAASCGRDAGAARPTASSASSSSPPADDAPSARRPTRRYRMTRVDDRCEVGFTDDRVASKPIVVPCPGQIANGERIRLAGKVCLRESPGDASREVPVLCPDHLLVLERAEREKARADAGP
jgi:hypothetical protein